MDPKTQTKRTILIMFGGKSVEHEVSVNSARNIVNALDTQKYDVFLVGIDHGGKWVPIEQKQFLEGSAKRVEDMSVSAEALVIPYADSGSMVVKQGAVTKRIDAAFPVLHGQMGEDGTMQGLLTLAGVPFVGASTLGSAVGMDKDVTKRLLHEAGLPIAKWLTYRSHQREQIKYAVVEETLGLPCFVKPANAGSSVGVSKVRSEAEFAEAVDEAFRFDTKILIEEGIVGREVECSVLGNEKPTASMLGDIVAQSDDFYSYEAKYIDENGAALSIPAQIPDDMVQKVRDLAIKVYETVCCEGMARVDCFVTEDQKIYVNEINTLPGFTSISMYPKLWEYTGIPYSELIDTLIDLAIVRHTRQQALETSYRSS
jgi:D-alanine-D-alanine ligase